MTNEAIAALLNSSQSATLDDAQPDYPIIRVANAHGEAAIALHGAQVIDFRSVEGQPLLYLSPNARFREGTAIRGGIPLCWPWFGTHPEDPTMPFHGFARDRFWEFEGVSEPEDGVTVLAFRLAPGATPEGLWSRDFRLSFTVTVSHALDLALSTTNEGTGTLVVGGALHSYFAVSEIEQVTVEGLEGHAFVDAARGGAEGLQEGPIRFDRPINRVYRNTGPVSTVVDPDWRRRITIDAKGSRTTVVWNPWIEQARAFRDLPDEGYHHFVCVETANAGEDCPRLGPGERHTLGCRISSETWEDDAR